MTLIQLRVFCAVVEQGSFRAAARAFDMAQSTLTQAIQNLELELGVTLLNRSHQGISVTEPGDRFLVKANAIIRDCERAAQDMQQQCDEPEGQIALGVTSEPLAEFIMPVLKRFIARFPKVRVHVSSGYSKMLIEKIHDGRLDFALCPLAPQVNDADLRIERLYRSEAGVIARKGHPLAHATSIRELADCDWVSLQPSGVVGGVENRLISLFRAEALGPPRIVTTAESLLETLHIVSETDCLTIEPRMLADFTLFSPSLITIPIREAFDPRDVCLINRRASPLTSVAQEFVDMLISFSRTPRGDGVSTLFSHAHRPM
ncbi:LysR family transcriptional regulator [Paraburkholderia strydomiana]|uniref:LysR family transcriptional regulator n=1 Tax=Paraburkholderia strydomiana TaxID=1245417 RepID=UPI001BE60DF0|nr:LysR substrate-binding domain-containing protein [Paraburkholderia strydomiana]MBT2790126.1 LysR family transcriptional regulator [Paraburkholderia strydomiana]